jgi:PAS domain S-box-containing protein
LPDRPDRLRIAFEDAPPGLVVSRDDSTIRLVNAAAATIFGFSPVELVGQPISRVLPAAQDDEYAEFWRNPLSPATLRTRNVAGIRRDGVEVPLELRLRSLEDGTGRHVIASIVEITERIDLEASIAAVTRAHLELQQLVAKVAARFCAIEPDAADDATVEGLRQIGEALQLDWTGLWRWSSGEALPRPRQPWMQSSGGRPGDPFPIASVPWVLARLEAGESCCFTTLTELPDSDRDAFRRAGLRSGIVLPLTPTGDGDRMFNALALGSSTHEQQWTATTVEHLRLIAIVVSQAFARRDAYRALQKALEEIRRTRDRAAENVELRREVKIVRTSRSVVSESAAIQSVLAQIQRVAPTPATVLLLGETGTGKEVMAEAIHELSPRRQRPMIRVSCAAIPTALIESELFGRERGAYTGALSRQIGRFEAANQSTLFLDEIGELPMEVQVKLLRVLQERVIERLGSTQSVKVDVRIIAATNRNLEDAVRDRTFREDLFYRLNVFPVVVPPLRERVDDIPALVWNFIDEFSRSFGKTIDSISKASLSELQQYPWPGNVRELRNVIERAVIVATGSQLVVGAPRVGERPVPHTAMTLNELEIEHIRTVLRSTGWRVRGSGGAAERLGLKPTTLESRMARLGIAREKLS